jgi:hypothetical protein
MDTQLKQSGTSSEAPSVVEIAVEILDHWLRQATEEGFLDGYSLREPRYLEAESRTPQHVAMFRTYRAAYERGMDLRRKRILKKSHYEIEVESRSFVDESQLTKKEVRMNPGSENPEHTQEELAKQKQEISMLKRYGGYLLAAIAAGATGFAGYTIGKKKGVKEGMDIATRTTTPGQ